MIATRLSSVWQVAGVAGAALCCYLVSQSVATQRAALAKVGHQITDERDAIAKLTTEITTRSRLTQIESWNRQLALQAPRPGQYMDSGFQLASLYARDTKPQLPLDPAIAPNQGPVQTVSLGAPSPPAPRTVPVAAAPAPAPAISLPARGPIVQVAFHPAKAEAKPAPAAKPAPPAEPMLRVASFVRPKASRLDAAAPEAVEAAYHSAPTSLLPAALLSTDIATIAKAEQAKRAPKKPAE